MIEVFRTSVRTKRSAAALLRALRRRFPHDRFSFDLDDCDKIFRVETVRAPIDYASIHHFFQQNGFQCAPLPD